MKKYSIIFFCLISFNVFAQTNTEIIQNGVASYNAMMDFSEKSVTGQISNENIYRLKDMCDSTVALLKPVFANGNTDEVKIAKYFTINAKYEYGFKLGAAAKQNQSYLALKEIQYDITALTPEDFPLNYQYFGSNYVIKWSNFGSTQAEFYAGMGELAYNMATFQRLRNSF